MVDMFFAACPRVGDKDLNLHVIVCVHDQPCMFIAIPSGSLPIEDEFYSSKFAANPYTPFN